MAELIGKNKIPFLHQRIGMLIEANPGLTYAQVLRQLMDEARESDRREQGGARISG